jgi:hypothetical protein
MVTLDGRRRPVWRGRATRGIFRYGVGHFICAIKVQADRPLDGPVAVRLLGLCRARADCSGHGRDAVVGATRVRFHRQRRVAAACRQ